MIDRERDAAAMQKAIQLALRAEYFGERPFGCVILNADGQEIGEGYGSEETLVGEVIDPTRHSELIAIRQACRHQRGLLQGCTLYTTHEPCRMCIGAIQHAKLQRVVWGSSRRDLPGLFRDRQHGGRAAILDTSNPPIITAGLMRDECVALFASEMSALENERAGL